MTNSTSRLVAYLHSTRVQLCCGVDPDPRELIRVGFDPNDANSIRSWITILIELAAKHTKVFKLQKAFFDLLPESQALIEYAAQCIHDHDGFMILDAKVGDTSNTMRAYWSFAHRMKADFLMITPYLGPELWETPTFNNCDPAVLIRSSNPGARRYQDLRVANEMRVWEMVLNDVINSKNKNNTLLVFSSRSVDDITDFIDRTQGRLPVLFGGFGRQNVQAQDVNHIFSEKHCLPPLFNSSRDLTFPQSEEVNSGNYRQVLTRSFRKASELSRKGSR